MAGAVIRIYLGRLPFQQLNLGEIGGVTSLQSPPTPLIEPKEKEGGGI